MRLFIFEALFLTEGNKGIVFREKITWLILIPKKSLHSKNEPSAIY